jgi:DNA-directed RNA polymerase specialized sigma24 family protein
VITMPGGPSLAGLVARARNGDQQAWDILVDRYAPLLWSICRSHELSGPDATAVSHSVWAQLASQLDTIRDPGALAGWLATTTHRECSRAWPAAPRPPAIAQVPGLDHSPGTPAGAAGFLAERQAALREAFARLSPASQRLIALLIADPPVPDATIEAELGSPAASIGSARRRCLQQLRGQLALAALGNAQAETPDCAPRSQPASR